MRTAVVVVAAGQGQRMGSPIRKQYMTLEGMPVLARSVAVFFELEQVKQVIAVIPPGELDIARKILKPYCPLNEITFVEGGHRRQDSVFKGLQAVKHDMELVCIHDGARPLVTPALVNAVLKAAEERGAAIPGLPVTDTIKEIDHDGTIRATVFRDRMRLAQTPQAFRRELIMEAYAKAFLLGVEATDDAYLLEMMEFAVHVIPGEPTNIKITGPHDLLAAAAYLKGGKK